MLPKKKLAFDNLDKMQTQYNKTRLDDLQVQLGFLESKINKMDKDLSHQALEIK